MTISEPLIRSVLPGTRREKIFVIARTALFSAVVISCFIYAWIWLSPMCLGAVLHPPVNISAAWTSASQTRIQWAPSVTTTGNSVAYAVSVCEAYGPCFANSKQTGCTHRQTSHSWLEFGSNVDTPYCIVVKAVSRCGRYVVVSDPSVMKLRTPSFAPGDFQVRTTNISHTSAKIVAFPPHVKNGALEMCYITIHDLEAERIVSCSANNYVVSVTELTDLKPSTEYNLSVTFANIHNGWEMGTRKTISFTTLGVPADANNSQGGDSNSDQGGDNSMLFIICVVGLIYNLRSPKTEDDRRPERRRRRRRH